MAILKRALPDFFGRELAIGDVVAVVSDSENSNWHLAKVNKFIKPRRGCYLIVSTKLNSKTKFYSQPREVIWMEPSRITAYLLEN